MEADNPRQGPLHGVRVADFTHAQAGPYCTMMLGDMGAEIIKIEPLSGDHFRAVLDGFVFINVNRNKRGIALNLKKDEGKEIALRLASKADVVIENFVPGSMDRLGLGYDSISRINPRVIYCSISGFGQNGPYRERPAYDPVIQAMSGIMEITGESDRPPVRILPPFIDYSAGVNAAFGIVVSLMEREKTDNGKRLDIALLDVALTPMGPYVTLFKKTGKLTKRLGSSVPATVPYQNFETSDGLIYIAVITDQMWKNLCKALKSDELESNSNYSTYEGRNQYRNELVGALNKVTKKYGGKELESKLLEMGIPCGRVRSIDKIIEDPHVELRQILEDVDYPTMGKVTTVKTPIFFSGRTAPTRLRAPLLGEHTKEVLTELGYSEQEVQEFISKGVALQYNP